MQRMFQLGLLTASLLINGSSMAEGFQKEAISAIGEPVKPPMTAQLGKELFTFKGLSGRGFISCQNCHQPHKGFSQKISGKVQTLSLLNVSLNDRFFWNGRADTLQEAIKESLYDITMMGNNKETFIHDLNQNEKIKRVFTQYYADGITEKNIVDALAQYLKTLQTPHGSFDKFLNGDQSAISDKAKEGYKLFKDYGCISCHQGMNIGGNLMQKYGVYKSAITDPKPYDLGYYEVTKDEDDKFVFRVPSLRNVSLTAPYMHNGSKATLLEAITHMGDVQLNQVISNSDAKLIEHFLNSLTADLESSE